MDVMFSKDILVNTEWKAGTVRSNIDGTRIIMGVKRFVDEEVLALVLEDDRGGVERFDVFGSMTYETAIEDYPIVIKGSRIVLGGINV